MNSDGHEHHFWMLIDSRGTVKTAMRVPTRMRHKRARHSIWKILNPLQDRIAKLLLGGARTLVEEHSQKAPGEAASEDASDVDGLRIDQRDEVGDEDDRVQADYQISIDNERIDILRRTQFFVVLGEQGQVQHQHPEHHP